MNKLQKIVLNNVIWLDWLLPALMTLSGVFLGYDISKLKLDEDSHLLYISKFVVSNLGWVLSASIIVYVFIKVIEATARPKLKKIENELEEYRTKHKIISEQVRNLFDGYLYNLANRLEFGKESDNNERISLYIHDQNNTFIPCGRYSANPQYRKPSRTSYPDNEGCIARGWENGWHFDNKFPCPNSKKSKYGDYCSQKYNIPKNTTRDVKMKSRVYAVLSIKNNGDPFGVLVVESTKEDRFIEDQIKPILQGQNDFLAETIRQLRDYIPTPDTAKSRGL